MVTQVDAMSNVPVFYCTAVLMLAVFRPLLLCNPWE